MASRVSIRAFLLSKNELRLISLLFKSECKSGLIFPSVVELDGISRRISA